MSRTAPQADRHPDPGAARRGGTPGPGRRGGSACASACNGRSRWRCGFWGSSGCAGGVRGHDVAAVPVRLSHDAREAKPRAGGDSDRLRFRLRWRLGGEGTLPRQSAVRNAGIISLRVPCRTTHTPSRASPSGSRACAQLARSNACIGWSELEHHVVGRVHHVVDRAHAHRLEPAPRATAGDGPDRDAADHGAHGSAGSDSGVLDGDRGRRRRVSLAPARRAGGTSRRSAPGIAAAGTGVPYDADSSRATPLCESRSGRLGVTSTTRRVSAERHAPRATACPARASVSSSRMPSCSSPSPSSRAEQSMPSETFAADLARFSMREPLPRHRGAEPARTDRFLPGRDVRRAADDVAARPCAVVHLGQTEVVGVGMRCAPPRPRRDDDRREIGVQRLDGVDRRAEHVRRSVTSRASSARRRKSSSQRERDVHARSSSRASARTAPGSACRNRSSSRMSGTP